MFSAYRNKDAKPNRITDNHHHQSSDIAGYCFLICFGIIGVVGVQSYIKKDAQVGQPTQPAIVQMYLRADYCMTCHIARSNPVIKNLKEYKKAHPALSQKRILQDLIATTGANL